MIRRTLAIAAATLPVLGVILPAPAAYQETQPTTQVAGLGAAPEGRLQATITGVEGIVQVRTAEGQPWQKVTVGMVVDEGAEFRTGPRSAVRFTLPPDQVVTLDRLGTVKLLEAISTGTRVKTDLGMQYGRVRYDIEAAGQEHDSTIHTPGSTLAVRGTRVGVENTAAFPVKMYSLEGKARYNTGGKSGYFGGYAGTSQVVEGTDGPASTAFVQTFADPSTARARSPQEQVAILQQPLVTGLSSNPGLPLGEAVAPPPVVPPPTTPPPTNVPGSLVFQLVWIQSSTDKGSVTPDVDLFVITPRGENLCPKDCLETVKSGGISPKDDTGGGNFRFGEEVAIFPKNFPGGDFKYEVRHVSGESAEFQLAVLKDGELIGKPVNGTVDSTENRVVFESTITGKTPTNPGKPTDPTTPTKPTPPQAAGKTVKPVKSATRQVTRPVGKPVAKPMSKPAAKPIQPAAGRGRR